MSSPPQPFAEQVVDVYPGRPAPHLVGIVDFRITPGDGGNRIACPECVGLVRCATSRSTWAWVGDLSTEGYRLKGVSTRTGYSLPSGACRSAQNKPASSSHKWSIMRWAISLARATTSPHPASSPMIPAIRASAIRLHAQVRVEVRRFDRHPFIPQRAVVQPRRITGGCIGRCRHGRRHSFRTTIGCQRQSRLIDFIEESHGGRCTR